MPEISLQSNTKKELLTFHEACSSILTFVCLSQITLRPSSGTEMMMYRPTVWTEYSDWALKCHPSRRFWVTFISRRIRVTSSCLRYKQQNKTKIQVTTKCKHNTTYRNIIEWRMSSVVNSVAFQRSQSHNCLSETMASHKLTFVSEAFCGSVFKLTYWSVGVTDIFMVFLWSAQTVTWLKTNM